MDKITVAELASECSVQNQVVLSELKRLGLYVFSPSATIDATFADTIRKKILNQRETDEARQAEAEKKREAHEETAKQGKKIAAKKAVTPAEAPEAPKANFIRSGHHPSGPAFPLVACLSVAGKEAPV